MRCSSYCTANEYLIENLVIYLNNRGLEPKYFDDIVYIQKESEKGGEPIDIFIFPFGCAIIWGADEREENIIIEEFKAFDVAPNPTILSEFIYFAYDEVAAKTFIDEETNKVILGNKSAFVKLSISHALAQSVKLSALEKSASNLLEKTSPIQKELAKTGSVSLSKKEISQQIGILFNEKYSINLHSDILDIPEFFWRRPSYEPLYIMTAEFQDITLRQEILHNRLNMIHELYTMLSHDMDYKHSTRLEWIVIVLIAMEVIVGMSNHGILHKIVSWF
jgi:uncharacterized Rmd1/YagE family protein